MATFQKETPKKDDGHVLLMQDIADLASDATNYEFHDFKNEKYAVPKVELRNRLLAMAQAVIDGKYDN